MGKVRNPKACARGGRAPSRRLSRVVLILALVASFGLGVLSPNEAIPRAAAREPTRAASDPWIVRTLFGTTLDDVEGTIAVGNSWDFKKYRATSFVHDFTRPDVGAQELPAFVPDGGVSADSISGGWVGGSAESGLLDSRGDAYWHSFVYDLSNPSAGLKDLDPGVKATSSIAALRGKVAAGVRGDRAVMYDLRSGTSTDLHAKVARAGELTSRATDVTEKYVVGVVGDSLAFAYDISSGAVHRPPGKVWLDVFVSGDLLISTPVGGSNATVYHIPSGVYQDGFSVPEGYLEGVSGTKVLLSQPPAIYDLDTRVTEALPSYNADHSRPRAMSGSIVVGFNWWDGGTEALWWTNSTLVAQASPTFSDVCGAANDTYTIPSTRGVDYMVAGVVKLPGTYPASGTVSVTAQPKAGYLLQGVSSWSRSFTNRSSFTDVPSTIQFFDEICWLSTAGISTGYPDGTYRPVQPVNRDAMAAFMYRLAGSPTFTPPARSPFKDVTPQTQFYKEIAWLASKGISTGYPDGTFRPVQPVNRDAMAAFMYRLAGSPEWSAPSTSPFTDVTLRTQFYSEITWLASKKITTGYSDGTFRPVQPVNRDAMAAFMYRLKVVNKAI